MRRSALLLVGLVLVAAACGTETDRRESSGPRRVAATSPTVPATIATTTTTTLPPPPPAPVCTDGYSPCLVPASDYDCDGGSGDGPAYTGAVTVTGVDIYALDADGDGSACEPYYEPDYESDPYLDDGYEPYEPDPCDYLDCENPYEPEYDPGYYEGYP